MDKSNCMKSYKEEKTTRSSEDHFIYRIICEH